MPVPDSSISWWMTLSALGVIALVSFLVTWGLTDLIRLPRAAYLAALMIVTGALTWGYLVWSGTDAWAFISHNWAWGLLGAVLSGGIGAAAITRAANRGGLPKPAGRSMMGMSGAILWEGLLYGAAEGLLLSVLPVLAAWQTFQLLGWTGTIPGAIGSGVLALVASAVVIYVHHLGYQEYRRTREIMLPILACGMLSLAYLLTQSPIAPVGGHFILHTGALVRGLRMPPYSKRLDQLTEEEPVLLKAA